MATGKDIERRGHKIGFKEEINKSSKDKDVFFTWFNDAKDADASFIRGAWDFSCHIALPIAKYLSNPENKICLEIGHGGGRLLATASRHFKKVIGVDIHNENEIVQNELTSRGCCNVELLQNDGNTIPLNNNSVDFIYSFIVFQHLEKIEIFENYIKEIHRILKKEGIAIIYFGRKYKYSYNRFSKVRLFVDKIVEELTIPSGYIEIPSKVNATNLRVTMRHAKNISMKFKFTVLDELTSFKKVPDGYGRFGGQHGLILKKS